MLMSMIFLSDKGKVYSVNPYWDPTVHDKIAAVWSGEEAIIGARNYIKRSKDKLKVLTDVYDSVSDYMSSVWKIYMGYKYNKKLKTWVRFNN